MEVIEHSIAVVWLYSASLSFIPKGHSKKNDAGNHNSELQNKNNMTSGSG